MKSWQDLQFLSYLHQYRIDINTIIFLSIKVSYDNHFVFHKGFQCHKNMSWKVWNVDKLSGCGLKWQTSFMFCLCQVLRKVFLDWFFFNLTFFFLTFFSTLPIYRKGYFQNFSGNWLKMKYLKFDKVPKKVNVGFLCDIWIRSGLGKWISIVLGTMDYLWMRKLHFCNGVDHAFWRKIKFL